jgi:hypothetical protein
VVNFVDTHYLPQRLIIAAAGNIEYDDFVAQVQDAFWPLSFNINGVECCEETNYLKRREHMELDPTVKRNWIEIQKHYSVPVNAIGVKIDPKDEKTLKVWKEEGIDQFLHR